MNIVLIGFMGAGKSKIGRLLAKKIGWTHVDTDDNLFKRTGKPAGVYLREAGEKQFRKLERDVIAEVSALDKTVISTGGGVPLNDDNMADLKRNGTVVWLKASPEIILGRLGDIKTRPLIDPKDPVNSVRERLSARVPFYEKADHIIDTDNIDGDAVVSKIAILCGLS